MAWRSLTGGQFAPIIVSVMPVADWTNMKPPMRKKIEAGLTAFMQANAGWSQQIAAMSAGR